MLDDTVNQARETSKNGSLTTRRGAEDAEEQCMEAADRDGPWYGSK